MEESKIAKALGTDPKNSFPVTSKNPFAMKLEVTAKKSMRDEAKAKLAEAYELLKKVGIPERFTDLAEDVVEWKDLEHTKDEHGCEYIQFLSCAVCGPDAHTLELVVRKQAGHHWQYNLELVLNYSYHNWGFWEKVKEVFYTLRRLFWDKREENAILLKGDDLTKFKDVLKRL